MATDVSSYMSSEDEDEDGYHPKDAQEREVLQRARERCRRCGGLFGYSYSEGRLVLVQNGITCMEECSHLGFLEPLRMSRKPFSLSLCLSHMYT